MLYLTLCCHRLGRVAPRYVLWLLCEFGILTGFHCSHSEIRHKHHGPCFSGASKENPSIKHVGHLKPLEVIFLLLLYPNPRLSNSQSYYLLSPQSLVCTAGLKILPFLFLKAPEYESSMLKQASSRLALPHVRGKKSRRLH